MERKKEYGMGEIITCPRCDGDSLDCDESPEKARCLTCGLEFETRTVAVWQDDSVGQDKHDNQDTIFILTREDVIVCAQEIGIPPEAITDDILSQVIEGVEWGLECWSTVVKEAINMALKG